MSLQAIDFVVGRGDLRQHKLVAAPVPDLKEGEVLLKIDKFAFTSNNVTYAAYGDEMHYWDFFPAPEGWGRVPVWGFADVAASKCDAIAVGERIYGYLPMSTHLVVRPEHVKAAGFVDASAHRAQLPVPYNRYVRAAADPGYAPAYEDHQALLRPLFMTAFFIDDFFADNHFFGAQAVLLASASSKTAIGVGYMLAQGRDIEVIGLTSAGNVGFVEATGYYDRVLTYDKLTSLPADLRVIFVDMAGNTKVVAAAHHHFREAMTHSCNVGNTHWESRSVMTSLPGPSPQSFFTPKQLAKRAKDWGPGGIEAHFAPAWRDFIAATPQWMQIVRGRGPEAVEAVYLDMLEGRVKPNEAHMLSL
ncbi:MAG TPA: DUF2855 family protein [Parvibaculum sp.]